MNGRRRRGDSTVHDHLRDLGQQLHIHDLGNHSTHIRVSGQIVTGGPLHAYLNLRLVPPIHPGRMNAFHNRLEASPRPFGVGPTEM